MKNFLGYTLAILIAAFTFSQAVSSSSPVAFLIWLHLFALMVSVNPSAAPQPEAVPLSGRNARPARMPRLLGRSRGLRPLANAA